MANANFAFGLRWEGDISSGLVNGMVRKFSIPSSDSTDYFVGDPVKSTGTGTADGLPSVIIAAAGDTLRGVIVGFDINPNNLNIIYGAASTTRTCYVVESPFAEFICQSNGTGVATDLSGNMDLVAGSGSTTTGLSGWQLNEATIASTSAQIRILRVYPSPDNALGANVKYVVMINEHEFKSTTGVH